MLYLTESHAEGVASRNRWRRSHRNAATGMAAEQIAGLAATGSNLVAGTLPWSVRKHANGAVNDWLPNMANCTQTKQRTCKRPCANHVGSGLTAQTQSVPITSKMHVLRRQMLG